MNPSKFLKASGHWSSTIITLGRLISVASTVLTSSLIARNLGPEIQGRIVSVLTIGLICSTVLSLSIDQTFFTQYSANKNHKQLAAYSFVVVLALFLVGIITLFLGMSFASSFLPFSFLEMIFFLIILFSYLINSLSVSLFLLEGKIHLYLFLILSQTFFILITVFVLLQFDQLDLESSLFAYAVNLFLSAIFCILFSKPRVSVLSIRLQKDLILGGVKYHLGTLARFLHFRVDIVLLAMYVDFQSVAIYSIAVSFVELLFVFTDSLANSKLQAIASKSLGEAYRISQSLVRSGFTLGLTYCLGLLIFGKFAIDILFGSKYIESGNIMLYFIPGILVLATSRGTYAFCTRLNSPIKVNLFSIASLFMNIALNLFLIPKYGATGAAISSTLSYSLLGFFYLSWFYGAQKGFVNVDFKVRF